MISSLLYFAVVFIKLFAVVKLVTWPIYDWSIDSLYGDWLIDCCRMRGCGWARAACWSTRGWRPAAATAASAGTSSCPAPPSTGSTTTRSSSTCSQTPPQLSTGSCCNISPVKKFLSGKIYLNIILSGLEIAKIDLEKFRCPHVKDFFCLVSFFSISFLFPFRFAVSYFFWGSIY